MRAVAAAGSWMRAEIAEQPAVLERIVSRWEQTVAVVAEALPEPLAGVAFVARGSSDNAALLGRYAVELYTGIPALLTAPSLVTRYQADLHYRDHLVVGVSQSGQTPEIVTATVALRGPGSRTLAVTNNADSPLAAACDGRLLLGAGPERAVPASKTVTASMLAVLAVATAVARACGRPDPIDVRALSALPEAVAGIVDDRSPAQDVAARWVGRDRLQVVGRGLELGAVLEVALKVKETAAVFAQGISAADLLHGPLTSLDPQVPVLLADCGEPEFADLVALADRLQSAGVDVVTADTSPAAGLSLPSALPVPLRTLPLVVRGQQLAYEWAMLAGRDPDAPPGLSKVTATT